MRTYKTNGQPATQDQRQAAAQALIEGETTVNAAKIAGVTRQTISRWQNHDPEFQAITNELRSGAIQIAQNRLAGLTETAIDTLAEICKHGEKDSDRVAAAKEILNRATATPLPALPDNPINPRDILGDETYQQILNELRDATNPNT